MWLLGTFHVSTCSFSPFVNDIKVEKQNVSFSKKNSCTIFMEQNNIKVHTKVRSFIFCL